MTAKFIIPQGKRFLLGTIYSIGSIFCPPADFLFNNLLINSVNDTKIVKVLVGYEASLKKVLEKLIHTKNCSLDKALLKQQ